MADLRCLDAVRLLPRLLDGNLPPEGQLSLELHVVVCSGCTAVLENMRTTIALLGALPRPNLSDAARGELARRAASLLAARRTDGR